MDIETILTDEGGMNRRDFVKLSAFVGGSLLLGGMAGCGKITKKRISVATGGTGGVYYVMGGGIASILTKYAGVEATAEVTAASVDNLKLVAAKKAEIAFTMGDVGYDAFKGQGNFKAPLPVRTLCVLYSNMMHLVAVKGKGITRVADLKGKRISTGAPGSGTEVKALRVLRAAGINPDKDIKKDSLGVSESAGALKDGKINAFFWDGGVPTGSVLDLASSPGINIALISHDDLIPEMVKANGPVYFKSQIPKKAYTGIDYDTGVAGVANLLMCHQDMDEDLGYRILKGIMEHLPELVAIHKEARNISLQTAGSSMAVPYHKGAQKYFKEKGITVTA